MAQETVSQLTAEIHEVFGQPALTVELVPRTCWFSNVRDHVSKAEWDRLRKATYQQAHYVCAICGGRGARWPVECHEQWCYDDEQSIQQLVGFMALCPRCHEVKHLGLAGLRGRGRLAQAHLATVNAWTAVQTDQYLSLVWRIWSARSQYPWKLDFRWLEQFGIHIEPRR